MTYPYLTLELSEGASDAEVRSAYLRMIQENPPEAPGTRFQEIHEAYELVKDEAARARLSLFGMAEDWGSGKLADLVPTPTASRRKIGSKAWLELIERSV